MCRHHRNGSTVLVPSAVISFVCFLVAVRAGSFAAAVSSPNRSAPERAGREESDAAQHWQGPCRVPSSGQQPLTRTVDYFRLRSDPVASVKLVMGPRSLCDGLRARTEPNRMHLGLPEASRMPIACRHFGEGPRRTLRTVAIGSAVFWRRASLRGPNQRSRRASCGGSYSNGKLARKPRMDARTMVVMLQSFSLNGLFLKPRRLKLSASTQRTKMITSRMINIRNDDCGLPHHNIHRISKRNKHNEPTKHEAQSTEFFMDKSPTG
jgi:hypothetical protein